MLEEGAGAGAANNPRALLSIGVVKARKETFIWFRIEKFAA